MRTSDLRTPARFVALVIALALAAGAAASAEQTGAASGVKAFVGARIVDGTGRAPIEQGTILVRDGRIEAIGPSSAVRVPSGAERIDVSGKTIIPGLVNAHGHVGDTRGLKSDASFYTRDHVLGQLGLYARYGVTTVFSLGGDRQPGFELRDGQETPALSRARLHVAGPVVTADDPAAARAAVDEVAKMKADLVKIRVDDNLGTGRKMAEPIYRAVIEQAHRHGLRVAAHIFYLDDAKSLLRAGVDFLAHSVRDRDVDDDLVTLMKARDVCLCPTLMREVSTFVYESTPAFFDDPFFRREADPAVLEQLKDPKRQQSTRESKSAQAYKQALEVASRNVKKLADGGVRIAMGTDTGPAARFQGYFEHLELERMVQAGLTPMQAIVSATRDAAACMKVTDRLGTLEKGKWADLLVLGANPLADIRNTRTLESVWIAGNRVGGSSSNSATGCGLQATGSRHGPKPEACLRLTARTDSHPRWGRRSTAPGRRAAAGTPRAARGGDTSDSA